MLIRSLAKCSDFGFDLQVTPILSIKFRVLSIPEKPFKMDFQGGGCGGHLGFLIIIILASFDLQVTQILSFMFRVS